MASVYPDTRREQFLEKPLPSSEESERVILGAILLDNAIIAKTVEHLRPGDFYSPLNRRVFAAMIALFEKQKAIDPILIGEELKKEGSLESMGGITTITNLTFGLPHFSNVDEYISTVRDKAGVRAFIRESSALTTDALSGDFSEEQLREKADQRLVNAQGRLTTSAPMSLETLTRDFPQLRPPVIAGLLRSGEVGNIIGKTKVKKSWLVYYILLCLATGSTLFGRFRCSPGRVLLIDNELHYETIAHRIPIVAEALGFRPEQYQHNLDIISLRGDLKDINQMASRIRACRDRYQLIVIDALYRMLPKGVAENANEGWTEVYNRIDQYAGITGAAFLLVHHATKGSQADKDVTDVGSGGGSQARAADTHIVLRPHREDGCVVLEAAPRSWQPVEPLPLRWNFPVWSPAIELDAAALKGGRPSYEVRRQIEDENGMEQVYQALVIKSDTVKGLSGRVGMGQPKIQRLVGALVQSGRVDYQEIKKRGQECNLYRPVPS